MAVDANVLIFASNDDAPEQARATALLEELVAGPELFYLFWPTLVAYLRVTTHKRLFQPPLTVTAATANVDRLLSYPIVQTGEEGRGFWPSLRELATTVPAPGKLIHDAHLVALMRQHGVTTIYTNDRDFRKFDGIRVIDPFAA